MLLLWKCERLCNHAKCFEKEKNVSFLALKERLEKEELSLRKDVHRNRETSI